MKISLIEKLDDIFKNYEENLDTSISKNIDIIEIKEFVNLSKGNDIVKKLENLKQEKSVFNIFRELKGLKNTHFILLDKENEFMRILNKFIEASILKILEDAYFDLKKFKSIFKEKSSKLDLVVDDEVEKWFMYIQSYMLISKEEKENIKKENTFFDNIFKILKRKEVFEYANIEDKEEFKNSIKKIEKFYN